MVKWKAQNQPTLAQMLLDTGPYFQVFATDAFVQRKTPEKFTVLAV